jgi:hypothetical protein
MQGGSRFIVKDQAGELDCMRSGAFIKRAHFQPCRRKRAPIDPRIREHKIVKKPDFVNFMN